MARPAYISISMSMIRAAAARAVEWGTTIISEQGYVVMRSPGGFGFCLVTHPAGRLASPSRWPRGHASLVDQVCLDIPGDLLAEIQRHLALGASMVGEYEHWAVLRDPSGAAYCITDRDPFSGRLPPLA